jgi:hypothetical protein
MFVFHAHLTRKSWIFCSGKSAIMELLHRSEAYFHFWYYYISFRIDYCVFWRDTTSYLLDL